MSDVLRIEKDGEVIWEGEISPSGMLLETKMMVKPVYDNMKADWFAYNNDVIKDTTYKTEQFKHMTLTFQSMPKQPTKDDIQKAAYEKALAEYEMALIDPPTDEEVAEALEKAADLFLTEGWAQGGYHVSKTAAYALTHEAVPKAYFIEKEEEEK
jgi:hypothetical protein